MRYRFPLYYFYFKNEKFGLKAHCYGKAEDFMDKILRGEVFFDPKKSNSWNTKNSKHSQKLQDRTPALN